MSEPPHPHDLVAVPRLIHEQKLYPSTRRRPRTEELTQIGRYVVLEKIGKGGSGVVLAAYDSDLDRNVALKLLDDDRVTPVGQARLVREARSLAKLSHPNIVQVYETGEIGDVPYLAMELVRGKTLRKWLQHEVPSRLQILEMFLAIGSGLAAAHEAGIVHRDFKPDNVLIPGDGRPRIVDFGLAALERVAESGDGDEAADEEDLLSLTQTGTVMGTPAYMAPEQWLGSATDSRSDQYAFCLVLYESLYGARPFEAKTMLELREAVLTSEPAPVAPSKRVPAKLHAAILRGLSLHPADRWADLDMLLEAIREVIESFQPGMFLRQLLPTLRTVTPLMLAPPALWLGLELAHVVAYEALSWLLVSVVQLALFAAVVLPLRARLLGNLSDRRVIAAPVAFVVVLAAHRLLVLVSGGSIEQMFAYDYLTFAGAGVALTLTVERSIWPMIVTGLAFATIAAVSPSWAPRMWLAFTLVGPLVVILSGVRVARRRAKGETRGDLRVPRARLKTMSLNGHKQTKSDSGFGS